MQAQLQRYYPAQQLNITLSQYKVNDDIRFRYDYVSYLQCFFIITLVAGAMVSEMLGW